MVCIQPTHCPWKYYGKIWWTFYKYECIINIINKPNNLTFSGVYCFELTKLWFERPGLIPGEIPGIKLITLTTTHSAWVTSGTRKIPQLELCLIKATHKRNTLHSIILEHFISTSMAVKGLFVQFFILCQRLINYENYF